jgi:hypothetical protein
MSILSMNKTRERVFREEAQMWLNDAAKAAKQGDAQEYDRCMKQVESYNSLAKAKNAGKWRNGAE